ncbi:zinc finger protein 236-like isoform X1 [Gigantopelta aegis]|uniref:zinc finger protein 236-like isoform X1 n=1 Tax=Gigantopelta aegis TaxID=1735272 RepID=UPI001B88B84D|nr:zinc finger protein 236-like isoform X1 [Gigantopelta aegis]
MDKQYSVEFFVSFIDAMQKLCRDYLHFEQGVELSGYLALEIDNIKKERYVLSEFVQSTGQVISESYCTKAFKTVKKLPERNTDAENVVPTRQSNHSRWGQRHGQIGDVTPNRYRKSSTPSSSSSSLLHGRTHTITSSSLEELSEVEASRDQSQQPLLSKWTTQTGSVSRGSKRNTLDTLSDSPSNKKEKVDPSTCVVNVMTESPPTHHVVPDLADTVSLPLSNTVIIKDETDTFLQTSADDSNAMQSTNNAIDEGQQQSMNNFHISPHAMHGASSSSITSAGEANMDSQFKNPSESPKQSGASDLVSGNENPDGILDEKGSAAETKSEDLQLEMDFQSLGPSSISHLSYQSFMNSQFRDVKMHKCQHCDFRTEYQGNLKRHMRVHTGEFFHCSLCPRHFSDKYELSIHMQLHTGTITCRYCGEEFTSKNRRWEHERQHKRDLPQM